MEYRKLSIKQVIEVIRSISKAKRVDRKKWDKVPEDFGWKETEEEYQRAQAKWMEEVKKRKGGDS